VEQTFDDWEIIIVDDGSTDETATVAEGLIEHYPDHAIHLLRQQNQGLSASRNNGIAMARGVYILPLDADDGIEPEMLAETSAVLQQQPEVGFVYTDVKMFGDEITTWSGGDYRLEKLLLDCILIVTTLFRRQAWEQVGGFRPMIGYEDWDFWIGLAEVGWQGLHLKRPLVRYRRTGGSMLAGTRRHDLELRAQIILNHSRLYNAQAVAWAREVCSPAYMDNGVFLSSGHWLRAFAGYLRLIADDHPRLLPKTLLRPLFSSLSARHQGYARRIARLLSIA